MSSDNLRILGIRQQLSIFGHLTDNLPFLTFPTDKIIPEENNHYFLYFCVEYLQNFMAKKKHVFFLEIFTLKHLLFKVKH